MMTRVLILGASGMLGHMLLRELSQSWTAYGTVRAGTAAELKKVRWFQDSRIIEGIEATRFDGVLRVLADVRPTEIINAVGLVKQREEAKDPVSCVLVNSLFPHLLARAANLVGARLIHISTDCVFSGRRGSYSEEDLPDPVDLYDRSKLMGEVVQERVLTIRTSLIGRELHRSSGLIEWFLSKRNQKANGYTRAVFSGLSTRSFALLIDRVIRARPELSGLFHVASEPINKYELLAELSRLAGLNIEVVPVDTPSINKSLVGTRFESATGLNVPGWHEMLEEIAADIPTYDAIRAQEALVAVTL